MSVMELASATILQSPVDTGRFRGNWQFGTTLPSGELFGPFSPSAVPTPDAAIGKLDVGETGYLINNVPYARAIEFGHSKQSAHGVVRVTVKLWPRIVMASVRAAHKMVP
jgi:hypothetical protein